MDGVRRPGLRLGLAAALVPVLSACLPGQPPASSPNPTPTLAPEQTPSASPSELTAEENLAMNPPAPVDVTATRIAAGVQIAWGPPPPVTVPHRYSDKVISYRVYRRAPGETEFSPIATVPELTYLDQSIKGTGRFEYVVSSIREQNLEGSRSNPPAVVTIG